MMKVLVADDSPTTRFVLKKNLKDWEIGAMML
ncbi:hypothetical protein MHK_003957 [Candidatus Magnetomorum sp. HK-1]|nr:hypothetical protein MHK_003957 [Candidatus Magnetomorum sp. HK-1]